MGKELSMDIDPDNLRLERLDVSENRNDLHFIYAGRQWNYDVRKDNLENLGVLPPVPQPPHWMVVDEEKNYWIDDRFFSLWIKRNYCNG